MAYPNLLSEYREDSEELISNLERLNAERLELQSLIDSEEVEREKLKTEIDEMRQKLNWLSSSLNRKTAARAEFDRAIRQGERTVRSLIQTYSSATNILKEKCSVLTDDDIMTTELMNPKNYGSTNFAKSIRSSVLDVFELDRLP